jgi:hypothetical protein
MQGLKARDVLAFAPMWLLLLWVAFEIGRAL